VAATTLPNFCGGGRSLLQFCPCQPGTPARSPMACQTNISLRFPPILCFQGEIPLPRPRDGEDNSNNRFSMRV
jgi:hypothetical protein